MNSREAATCKDTGWVAYAIMLARTETPGTSIGKLIDMLCAKGIKIARYEIDSTEGVRVYFYPDTVLPFVKGEETVEQACHRLVEHGARDLMGVRRG